MRYRDKILFFGALDDIIHRHQTFLHLRHHSLFPFQRQFLVGFELILQVQEPRFQILPQIVFITHSGIDFSFQLLLKIRKKLLGVVIVLLLLFEFDLLRSLPFFLALIENCQIFIPMLLHLGHQLSFDAVCHRLEVLVQSIHFFVLGLSLIHI